MPDLPRQIRLAPGDYFMHGQDCRMRQVGLPGNVCCAINPRVGKRHRFCAKAECIKTSRLVARKRWLRKGGRQYFGGSVDTQRVRTWRQMNPKYWRRRSRIRRRRRSDYVLTKRLAATLRYVALQDLIDTHLALKIGIISELTGAALQDTIAKEIRRLMLRGHAILRGKTPKS